MEEKLSVKPCFAESNQDGTPSIPKKLQPNLKPSLLMPELIYQHLNCAPM